MKIFSNLSETTRVMLLAIPAVCLIFLIIGQIIILFLFEFESPLTYLSGIALGCLVSMLKIILMEKSISKAIDMEKDGAMAVSRLSFIGRLLITGVFLGVAFSLPKIFGMVGVIVGVLSLQIAAYAANVVLKKRGISN